MDFDAYLQHAIDNIGYRLMRPEHRRTGKTYKMCMEIIVAAASISGKMLVLGIDGRHLISLYSMVVRVADATATTYTLLNNSAIRIGDCDIIFVESKDANLFAGAHPTPQRFVDHRTEEEFVLEGLRNLRDRLGLLKGGV